MPRPMYPKPPEELIEEVRGRRVADVRCGLDEEASGKLRELYEKLRERERSTPSRNPSERH